MTDFNYKVGDVVMLNSGGPKMTVIEAIQASNSIQCMWFNDGKFDKMYFNPKVVTSVEN